MDKYKIFIQLLIFSTIIFIGQLPFFFARYDLYELPVFNSSEVQSVNDKISSFRSNIQNSKNLGVIDLKLGFENEVPTEKEEEIKVEEVVVVNSTPQVSSQPYNPTPTVEVLVMEKFVPKVLIIGDSMVSEAVGQALERYFVSQGVEIHRWGKPSTGLSRRDYFDWENKFTELNELHEPNIVIVMMGSNDGQSITQTEFGSVGLTNEKWDEEYGKRVVSFIELFGENDLDVYWIGNPIAKSSEYSAKMERINKIYKEKSSNYGYVHYIDTWEIMKVDGKYSDFMTDSAGVRYSARNQDGIHLSIKGGEYLVGQISKYFTFIETENE